MLPTFDRHNDQAAECQEKLSGVSKNKNRAHRPAEKQHTVFF